VEGTGNRAESDDEATAPVLYPTYILLYIIYIFNKEKIKKYK
jgi:hypothetical protein